jgi:hypothetical protein
MLPGTQAARPGYKAANRTGQSDGPIGWALPGQ